MELRSLSSIPRLFVTSEAVRGWKWPKTEQNDTTSNKKGPDCFRLHGSVVKVLDCGARGPGFDPRCRQKNFFYLFLMDSEEIDIIKDHRHIGNRPFVRRRSIGPLPSCFN